MKIILIIKFFLRSNTSKYRRSLIFPLFTILIGSFVISMTFSIMTGMHDEIIQRIKTFTYPYKINNVSDYDSNADIRCNFGISEFCLISSSTNDKIVKLNLFNNIKEYESILYKNKYIIKSSNDYYSNQISVGSDLAEYLNVDIGDSITLSSILDINIVTGKMNNNIMVVGNIFQFDFLNYDADFIYADYNYFKSFFLKEKSLNIYFPDYDSYRNYNIKENQNEKIEFVSYIDENKELITAMNIEKFFYIFIGFFTIAVSGIMIYNNTVLSFLEKKSQHTTLLAMGLKKNRILYFMLFSNLLLSSSFMFLGIFLTYLIIYLNKKYYILNYVFLNMPFKVLPMNSSLNIIFITMFIVLLIVIFSTLIPYLQYGNKNLNKQIKEIVQ